MVDFYIDSFGTFNDKFACDTMIRLKMSSIRFVCLHRFISEMHSYFTELRGIEAMARVARDKAKEAVESLAESRKRENFLLVLYT